jgi:osmotically-inducible protein OsmY
MARDDYGWDNDRSRRPGSEQDRNPRGSRGGWEDNEWSGSHGDPSRARGGNDPDRGGWDEGQSGNRGYNQGVYNQRPGTQGQEGGPSGQWGQQGWGSYSRGSNLGRARSPYGNTGGDNYGGGGFNGGSGYGSQQGPDHSLHHGHPLHGPHAYDGNADQQQWGANSGGMYSGGPYGSAGQFGAQYGGSQFGSGAQYGDIGQSGFGSSSGYLGGTPGSMNTGLGGSWSSGMSGGLSGGFGGYGGNSGAGNSADRTGSQNWGQSNMGQGSTSAPNHVGRGPKGWKRSDDRIREDVSEQLERHPQIDATDIEIRVENGEVTLMGTAPDRRTKRLAEDVAEAVSGVQEVQNQIRVKREGGVLAQLFGGNDEEKKDDPPKRKV